MQREGLIIFALLLTLAALAPQGDNNSEAAAQTDTFAPLDISQGSDDLPAMSLTGPDAETDDCDAHDHVENATSKSVHMKFDVNVSI